MDRQTRVKTWILRVVLYVLTLFALAMIAGTRIPSFGRWLTSLATVQGGDLYAMSGLSFFRETNRHYVAIKNDCSLREASVIVFCDSFGNVSPGEGAFHTRLQNALGVPVYRKMHRREDGARYLQPLQWLNEEPEPIPKGKILVWLEVERCLFGMAYNSNLLSAPPTIPPASTEDLPESSLEAINREPKSIIRRMLFDNSKLEYLLKNSFMTRRAYEMMASGRFILYSETSSLVPKYSLRPKMLFYSQAVNSFNQSIERKRPGDMLEFFDLFEKEINEKYGMTLVFVPVPNKYTIYHDYADPTSVYNDFLPIFTDELEKQGTICVEMYPAFMRQRDEVLYWSDDTHWNGKGIDIAVKLTVETIKEHGLLNGREQGERKELANDANAGEPAESSVVAE